MHRFRVSGLTIVLVIAAFLAIGWWTLDHAASFAAPAAAPAQESPCVPDIDKWAHPKRILLGETVDVTLTVRAVCPGERIPLHIVLVLDASNSMSGTPTQQLKQATAGFVRGLNMDQYPTTRVGVVEYNTTARTLSQLTNEERRAIGAINRVGASGGTRIDAGIQEGIRVMRQGRGNEKDITEVMIVLSDGTNNAGCNPVLQAARQARGQGILMIAICLGSGCDEQCMRQVASSPRYYYRAADAGNLQGVFQEIRDRTLNVNLKKLVVKDTLSQFVRYVHDSAKPVPSSPSDPSHWLQWDDVYVPLDGMTYTFKVQPIAAGYVPTNEEAWGELTDSKGRSKEWLFPVPWVTVLDADPLMTPDTPPPTVTPTVTASPTITPTPRPRPIYLPYDLR